MEEYTSSSYYSTMIEAKKEYFHLTGTVHEDEESYEMKMNTFNDWYIFQYISRNGGPFIKLYIEKNGLGEEIYNTFMRPTYSLFEYTGKKIQGSDTFNDIIHSTKISLAKDHRELSIMKKDLIIARAIHYRNQFYLLYGMTILPNMARPILVKESKKLQKTSDPHQEYNFLLNIEKMNTQYSRFKHVNIKDFFKF